MIHWLAIPSFLLFLITIRKKAAWEKAVALAAFLSYIFLLAKGWDYSRYMITLAPLLIPSLLYLCSEVIGNRRRGIRNVFFLICAILIFFNFFRSRASFSFFGSYKIRAVENHFPKDILRYVQEIRDLGPAENVLVLSERQLFFYYTGKNGIDFRDPKMGIFNRAENREKALDILKNRLKIKYIYVNWQTIPSRILQDIMAKDCDLVYQDTMNGFYLYRLREKPMSKGDLEKYFPNDSLLRNGSFESWSLGAEGLPDYFTNNDNIIEGMVVREENDIRVGKYAVKITGDNFNFAQNLSNAASFRGKALTFFAWMKTNVPNKYRLEIYDGVKSTFSKRHSGAGEWELLQANYTVSPSAETITFRVVQAEKTGNIHDVVYVDAALLVEGNWNTFYLYSRRDHVK
jgi:hypothetical protein